MIVDAAGGVVERGVRAANRHPGASQSQQHAALGAGVGQPFGSLEQDRMMADDQLGRCLDGLGRAGWGHGEASHEPLHGSLAFSEEQSGIVPVRGEFAQRELLQVFDDGGNGKHGFPRQEFEPQPAGQAALPVLLQGQALNKRHGQASCPSHVS